MALAAQELTWLESQTGQAGLTLNSQWMTLLDSLGYTEGTLNERKLNGPRFGITTQGADQS